MKVRKDPKRPFSIFVNDAQIVKLATIVFDNGSRTTIKVQFHHAARGLTYEEMEETLISEFKVQTAMIHKVTKIIIR